MTTAVLRPPSSVDSAWPTSARISFRQPVEAGGYIDAAWWPHTLELTAELPALMDVVWTAAREINRVTYNVHAWHAAPRRLQIEGRTVRVGGFTTSDPLTIRLSDAWGRERIDILVIAPDTAPEVALEALRLASEVADPLTAEQILARARGTAVGNDTAVGNSANPS